MPEPGLSALEDLTHEECVALLAIGSVGRVAVAMAGEAPLVVPVNYVLDGEVVVFRSDDGAKVSALRQGPASFQVDGVDLVHHTGWSVLVEGVAYEATDEEVAGLELEPWAGGEKRHWIRLIPRSITGRHIRPAPAVFDGRGYL